MKNFNFIVCVLYFSYVSTQAIVIYYILCDFFRLFILVPALSYSIPYSFFFCKIVFSFSHTAISIPSNIAFVLFGRCCCYSFFFSLYFVLLYALWSVFEYVYPSHARQLINEWRTPEEHI